MLVILEFEFDGSRPVRLDAFTVAVNAHGGLVELGLPLRVGQKFAVIHPGSEAPKSAKIVGIRPSRESNGFLLAFEFDSPTTTFWPVRFPPSDWSTSEA